MGKWVIRVLDMGWVDNEINFTVDFDNAVLYLDKDEAEREARYWIDGTVLTQEEGRKVHNDGHHGRTETHAGTDAGEAGG